MAWSGLAQPFISPQCEERWRSRWNVLDRSTRSKPSSLFSGSKVRAPDAIVAVEGATEPRRNEQNDLEVEEKLAFSTASLCVCNELHR